MKRPLFTVNIKNTKRILELSVVCLLLLPVLWINIKSSHDWGDDFAQYIHQAQNIVDGIPHDETGYLFNERNIIGPQAYPVGFPLLLAIVIAFKGVDLVSFNYLISVFLIASSCIGFLILRRCTSFVTALFTTLIISYHPFLLYFKMEVLSDLPFTCFSLLCVYLWYKPEKWQNSLVLGLLMAMTTHIRSIGFILLGSYMLLQVVRKKMYFKLYKNTLITFSVFVAIYCIINVLFPSPVNYLSFFSADAIWLQFNHHVSCYATVLTNFFKEIDNPYFFYIGVLSSACLVVFSVLGFFYKIKKQGWSPMTMYLLGYLAVIMVYPWEAGLRFLIPILCILFCLAIIGLRQSILPLTKRTSALAVLFGLAILFSYRNEWAKMLNGQHLVLDGPQTPAAQSIFQYIKTHTRVYDHVAFDKPRALSLYTNRTGVALTPHTSELGTMEELKKFKVAYLLIHHGLSSQHLIQLSQTDTLHFKLVVNSNEFKFYKINPL